MSPAGTPYRYSLVRDDSTHKDNVGSAREFGSQHGLLHAGAVECGAGIATCTLVDVPCLHLGWDIGILTPSDVRVSFAAACWFSFGCVCVCVCVCLKRRAPVVFLHGVCPLSRQVCRLAQPCAACSRGRARVFVTGAGCNYVAQCHSDMYSPQEEQQRKDPRAQPDKMTMQQRIQKQVPVRPPPVKVSPV